MRLRWILLILFASLASAELVYLVYANLQLESAIDRVAESADLDVAYESAYSRYPGDAQLRGVRVAGGTGSGWSLYLDRAEVSLHPTLPSALWAGTLLVPTQLARLQLGAHVLPVQLRGDL
ncbi:MAG TPA: hypothetical protein VFX59_18525, partial [Polyangiales bacterium]|nr:hypothetical protein [Polyangiales bacterium]